MENILIFVYVKCAICPTPAHNLISFSESVSTLCDKNLYRGFLSFVKKNINIGIVAV